MKKVLIIDNYDSFTYNVVEALRQLGVEPEVKRNDCFTMDEVQGYDKIIVSPGPGIPSEAGLMPEFLRQYATSKSILGICLGHQAIGERFGAKLKNMSEVMHGLQTPIDIIADDYIFDGMDKTIKVGRYHSWVVDTEDLPEDIIVTAVDSKGQIMALRHRELDVHGIQFHPESVLTPDGIKIFENFINH